MTSIPESHKETSRLNTQFQSEKNAQQYLIHLLYGGELPDCRKHPHEQMQLKERDDHYFFRCSRCKSNTALFPQTFFYNRKARISTTLQTLLHFWIQLRITQSSQLTGLDRHKTSLIYKTARHSIVEDTVIKITPIGGPGIKVQIDEALLRKRKFHRGRRKEKIWIFGGVENLETLPGGQHQGACFMLTVPNRQMGTIWPLIRLYIRPGSIIQHACLVFPSCFLISFFDRMIMQFINIWKN